MGRRTCFIELAPGLSRDPREIFEEGEQIFRRHGGQLHLGKATRATAEALQEMFGDRLVQFQRTRREQDAAGKFDNEFTRRLLGCVAAPEKESARTRA